MRKAFIALKGDPAEKDWQDLYRMSHKTFRAYAKKHGYDFKPMWYDDVDVKRWPGLISGREPRWEHDHSRTHPYWLKIPCIIETLEKYDVVVLMDSDCLILDDSVDIASVVHRSIALAEVDGWGGKVVSSAVSVTHRSEVSQMFWNDAWSCDAYLENTGWADNANIAYLLGWSLNAPWHRVRESKYMPHFHDLGTEWNAYTAQGGEYVPHCRVFHASGGGNPRAKMDWMNNALARRAQEK